MEKDESSSGNITPLASNCDGEESVMDDLGADILRSRLLQLYLARVLVNKSPTNDPDECNSMRVEDDDSDYAARRAFFDEDDEGESCGPREEEDRDLISKMDEVTSTVPSRNTLQLPINKRHSLQVPASGLDSLFDSEADGRPSPRTLEARRLAHFLQSGRRGSLQVHSELSGVTPEEESAKSAAWRMEAEVRNQLSRRGSLQTEPFVVLPRRGSVKNLREMRNEPTNAEMIRTRSAANLTIFDPVRKEAELKPIRRETELKPVRRETELNPVKRETEMKRREMNIMAPVSF